MKELAQEAGVLAPILDFGAQITLDTCILASPMLPPAIKTLMTNSAKYAYYAPSLLNTRVTSAAWPTASARGRWTRRARRVAVGTGVITGRPIVAGSAEGDALVTREALSFWGGYDFTAGNHRQAASAGRRLRRRPRAGRAVHERIIDDHRRAAGGGAGGHGAAAILTTGVDAFVALGVDSSRG